MRTYSTPQSAFDGEITKLAIIECVLSAALYVGLGVYFGTFKHLAFAVIVAPLMLFRTEASADWGLKVYGQWIDRLFDEDREWTAYTELLFAPVLGVILRLIATVYWVLRTPLQTLRDAPRNWLRQSFCTDFMYPPEILPLDALKGENMGVPTFVRVKRAFLRQKGFYKSVAIVALFPFLIVGYLPSIIYRVSFKATALAYTPFVWVARATLQNPLPIKARLERFTKGELEKVRRGVSYLVLTTLVAKGALVFNWIDRAKVEAMFPSQKIVTDFVVLDAWPWWQITFGADALLTFALLFFADAALSRVEAQRPWREESVTTTVATISFLRAVFGLVTIAHFFHVALLAAAPAWARPLLTF